MASETWKRLGPGIYVDRERALHIVDAELLESLGLPDTPASRRVVREAADQFMSEQGGAVEEGPAIGPDHKLANNPTCPNCLADLYGALDLNATDGPQPGKPIVCSNCGAVSVFTDHLFLRAATDEDRARWSPSLRQLMDRLSAQFTKRRA